MLENYNTIQDVKGRDKSSLFPSGTLSGSNDYIVTQNFCMKRCHEGNGNWPAESYCIFRSGGICPSGD